jgi:hypothetical protein
MIPLFNPNFYKDVYSDTFTYEPCKLDYWQRFKMTDEHTPLLQKIAETFIEAINEIEWSIRVVVSAVIYPLLDYNARRKCEYINELSKKAIYEFCDFIPGLEN